VSEEIETEFYLIGSTPSQSAGIGLVAKSDDCEEVKSVSNFKNKRPLMNSGRKDTFTLMEMKKLQTSSHSHNTDGDNLNPTTVTTITQIPQKRKVNAVNLGVVGEEDEESGEGQSLIHDEYQFHRIT
jgi:hypothetical protein